MDQFLVVVDTTEFKKSLRLAQNGWPRLLAWSRSGIIRVAATEVVVRESVRHFHRQRPDDERQLRQAAKKFSEHAGLQESVQAIAALTAEEVDSYDEWLREQLGRSQVEIWPLPNVSHDAVLDRDMAERKPFTRAGKGYRDALIWESLLENLPKGRTDLQVLLVTGNSSDFADADGDLHETLRDEAAAVSSCAIKRLDSLKACVDFLEDEADQALEYLLHFEDLDDETHEGWRLEVSLSVLAAAGQLIGTPVADDRQATPTGGFEIDLPAGVEDPDVVHVEPDPDTLEIDVYERYEGDTLLMQVDIDAGLKIQAFVDRADYPGIENEVSVVDGDWDADVMLVEFSRDQKLRFNVTTVNGRVEEVVFSESEPDWLDEN